ncbi:MAG: GTP-binding protein [Promethearchaeota archaeon]|nr:MAG: GTP-binding protein [Candidatus Lokiarchaeota archaeon]
MSLNINKLFNELFGKFLESKPKVHALLISDEQGLIIVGEKREEIDMEIISVLTTKVNPILEKIREEFAFKKFGTASFDTDEHRLLFISIDENITLTLVLDTLASIDKLYPYAYFLAEKSAQIIYEEADNIELIIPNFEYETVERYERINEQIYQLRLDSGGVFRFKFIIIGDHEVGKTSIVRRYVDNKFNKDYRATLGLNILTHSFEFLENDVSIALWDIGAQDFFKRFRKTYYTGAQAAFIVFDLTDRQSYKNIRKWYQELEDYIDKPDLPIVIVGNKSDLEEKRIIPYQEGVTLASELASQGVSKISYIETSALTGENVNDAFTLISYFYIQKSKEREEEILKNQLSTEIKTILEKKNSLVISIITQSPFWNPALQILTELKNLGDLSKIKDEKEEKIYIFSKGLKLQSYLYEFTNISNSDAILCIFDARNRQHIVPNWRDIVIKILEEIQENKVVLIGVRVSDTIDWSNLLEEFNVNEQLEKKIVSLLFFKIGVEYRLEIYDQLEIMLNSIKEF